MRFPDAPAQSWELRWLRRSSGTEVGTVRRLTDIEDIENEKVKSEVQLNHISSNGNGQIVCTLKVELKS